MNYTRALLYLLFGDKDLVYCLIVFWWELQLIHYVQIFVSYACISICSYSAGFHLGLFVCDNVRCDRTFNESCRFTGSFDNSPEPELHERGEVSNRSNQITAITSWVFDCPQNQGKGYLCFWNLSISSQPFYSEIYVQTSHERDKK